MKITNLNNYLPIHSSSHPSSKIISGPDQTSFSSFEERAEAKNCFSTLETSIKNFMSSLLNLLKSLFCFAGSKKKDKEIDDAEENKEIKSDENVVTYRQKNNGPNGCPQDYDFFIQENDEEIKIASLNYPRDGTIYTSSGIKLIKRGIHLKDCVDFLQNASDLMKADFVKKMHAKFNTMNERITMNQLIR